MTEPTTRLLTLLSVKLVQPGLLGDVYEGYLRLAPPTLGASAEKAGIKRELEQLVWRGVICLYAERRYMLTSDGESLVEESGVREKMESRRLFLLKETRKAMQRARSGTRDRSLNQ